MTVALASATRSRHPSRARSPVKTLWLVNGQPTGVDPADRGLAYGDGLFETMGAVDGHIRWLDLHFDRLEDGCRRLSIPAPPRAALGKEIAAHCPRQGRAIVKLIVTRGTGPRGYAPPEVAHPTRVLAISAWPEYAVTNYRHGISVHVCQLRLGENPALAGLKHLSRLEQVLAELELKGQGAEHGLLLDTSERVVGGTNSNLFAVFGTEIATPALTRCGVKGVMRRAVLEAAPALDMQVSERDLTLEQILGADELFMTNSLFGVWPIVRVASRRLPVGPATRRILGHFGYSDAA
jgi:4-amino-4-deoxychorismate lyase